MAADGDKVFEGVSDDLFHPGFELRSRPSPEGGGGGRATVVGQGTIRVDSVGVTSEEIKMLSSTQPMRTYQFPA